MFLWSSDASEGSFFLHFLSSAMADERFLYIFYLPPRRKNFLFTFFTFRHGGRTFSSRFLSSTTAEEHFFHIFYLPPRRKNVLFLFYYFPPWRKNIFFCFLFIRHVGKSFFDFLTGFIHRHRCPTGSSSRRCRSARSWR